MTPYRTIVLPTEVAEAVRASRRSPYAEHPVHAEVARGYGPCRHCQREFRIGEERRLLFTFDPFAELDAPPLPGPVFIHEEACEPFPADGGLPEGLRRHPLTLNAYARDRRLIAQRYVTDEDADSEIGRLLERPAVDYIHVRDTEAGCYDLRVERADTCDAGPSATRAPGC